MVIFTGILMAATIVLAWFTFKLWRTTKEAVGDTTEALKLAQKQFNVLSRQTNIIEAQHVTDHRPRLIIRDLILNWPTEGNMVSADFILTNKGEGNAIISEYSFSLVRSENGVLWPNGGDFTLAFLIGQEIQPGQREPGKITSNITRDQFHTEYKAATEIPMQGRRPYHRQMDIVFEGYVHYMDRNNLLRRSSFYRSYDFENARFGAADDPERDYAD